MEKKKTAKKKIVTNKGGVKSLNGGKEVMGGENKTKTTKEVNK